VHAIVVPLAAGWGLIGGHAVGRADWRSRLAPPAEAGAAEPGDGTVAAGGDPVPWPLAVLGAAVCAALALRAGGRPETVMWLLLVPWGLLLARIDLAAHRLPDALTLPAAGATAVLLGGAALLPGHQGSWGRALLGGVALAAAYLVLLLINPAGMGFGDVKLALTLGLVLGWYGWAFLVAGFVLTFLLASLAVAVLLLARRATRRTAVAFGPFMLLGTFGGLLLATAR
jgi:leader peptidase (prepilin peptidase)/N-methyltransferase